MGSEVKKVIIIEVSRLDENNTRVCTVVTDNPTKPEVIDELIEALKEKECLPPEHVQKFKSDYDYRGKINENKYMIFQFVAFYAFEINIKVVKWV